MHLAIGLGVDSDVFWIGGAPVEADRFSNDSFWLFKVKKRPRRCA